MRTVILVLFLPFVTHGQNRYSGSIVNKATGEPIPLATVGLMRANTGVNADDRGQFVLFCSDLKPDDSLLVSCLGYEPKKVKLDKTIVKYMIALNEKANMLNEVTVLPGKGAGQVSTLNDFKRCGTSYVTSSGYMTQVAQHFTAPEKNALLQGIEVCRFNLGVLDKERTRFRIRLYAVNKATGAPSVDLCNQIIEVKTGSKNVAVDMKPYHIRIPDNEFFIAIEWLKIPYNESRSTIKIDGQKKEYITYRPSIGWTDNNDEKEGTWFLDYKNQWQKIPDAFYPKKTALSIAATLAY